MASLNSISDPHRDESTTKTRKQNVFAKKRSASSHPTPSLWQKRFFKWIDKKYPPAKAVELTRKNLYTFPTLMGFGFLGLGVLLWVLGTNYQNNLILALSYLLMSLMIVAILHTYANLAGIRVKVVAARPVFAGDNAQFLLEIRGIRAKGNDNITLRWWSGDIVHCNFTGESEQILVPAKTDKRGYFLPGKLLVETQFPLGLIRCWTWLNLDARVVVFPKPLKVDYPGDSPASDGGEQGIKTRGDDFEGLRPYRPGDAIKHIAWKHYAQEQGLFSKIFASYHHQDIWLEWQSFLHLDIEQRLSALCYWAVEFDRLAMPYGLRIPGKRMPPALGDTHKLQVLSALARFDIPEP